jgi:hypothetical protein
MNAAEFKTLRESLGLPVPWVAAQAGARPRVVESWEEGKEPVPDDVAGLLASLDEQLWQLVDDYLEQVNEMKAQDGVLPEGIVLIRYRTDEDLWAFHSGFKPLPATSHAMLLARTQHALKGMGVASLIRYMEPKVYRNWLGKREDTETLRSTWAAIEKRPVD